tara:strand:+ start:79 stop:360 length:282 start_codon:yes stop_codon:yes gene_type:complete
MRLGLIGQRHLQLKAETTEVDPNSKANVYEWSINQIRKNLHCALCFSPVGDDFWVVLLHFCTKWGRFAGSRTRSEMDNWPNRCRVQVPGLSEQ